MSRLLLITSLCALFVTAQEVTVTRVVEPTQRPSVRYSVTLFSIQTSGAIEASSIKTLGQGELELDGSKERSNDFVKKDGDTTAKASLRRAYDPTGETRDVILRVVLDRRMNLGRSVQSDSVGTEKIPVAVSVSSSQRRSRSAEETTVVALLTEAGSKDWDVAALLACCVGQLRTMTEEAPTTRTRNRRIQRFNRHSSEADAASSILSRLPLKSLLSAEALADLLTDTRIDERIRHQIGTSAGDADSLRSLIKSNNEFGSGDSEQRAIAQGWANFSDPVLRGTAGIALFRMSPEVFGPLFANEVESGQAKIPPGEDAPAILAQLRVVRTWRNTTPAYLGTGAVLLGAIILAMGGRALLRRAVA